MTEQAPKLLLRVKEAAEVLGVSTSKLWKGARGGSLPRPVKSAGVTARRFRDLEWYVDQLDQASG